MRQNQRFKRPVDFKHRMNNQSHLINLVKGFRIGQKTSWKIEFMVYFSLKNFLCIEKRHCSQKASKSNRKMVNLNIIKRGKKPKYKTYQHSIIFKSDSSKGFSRGPFPPLPWRLWPSSLRRSSAELWRKPPCRRPRPPELPRRRAGTREWAAPTGRSEGH